MTKKVSTFNNDGALRKIGDRAALHMSKGNSKLGRVYNFSTLPGAGYVTNRDGIPICDVAGTCMGVCSSCEHDCYAVRIMRMNRPTVINAWAENTNLTMNPFDLRRAVLAFIDEKKPDLIRWHVSGEFHSYFYFEMVARICKERPDVIIYTYTKHDDFIHLYRYKFGMLPENFRVTYSAPFGTMDHAVTGLHTFVYDDGTDAEIASLPHCPAVDRDGKQTGVSCSKCHRCIDAKPGTFTAVHAH